MTTGSISRSGTSVQTPVYSRARFSPTADFGNWEYQGLWSSFDTYSKTWSGGDRLKLDAPIPIARKRYYTVREYDKNLRKTVKVRKFFMVSSYPRKRKKDKTPHPYSMSIRRYSDSECQIFDTFDWPGHGWNQREDKGTGMSRYYAPSTDGQPQFSANNQIELVGKLKNQLRGSDFNMAVFLGEGHQSLKLITDSATRLYRGYSAFRHGDLVDAASWLTAGRSSRRGKTKKQKAAKHGEDVSSQWLQLQYGWLPLLQDMKAGAEALSHHLNVPFRQRYVVRRNLRVPIDKTSPFASGFDQYSRQLIAYISEPESLPVISGLLDPELVAWELTPFSFVVDWVMPIGDYLAARAFATRLSGTFVTTDLRKTIRQGGRLLEAFIGNERIGYADFSASKLNYEAVDINRTVGSTLEVPMPNVKPLNKIASWKHCANALALLTQMFVKGKT